MFLNKQEKVILVFNNNRAIITENFSSKVISVKFWSWNAQEKHKKNIFDATPGEERLGLQVNYSEILEKRVLAFVKKFL